MYNLDITNLPEPILDEQPELVELYYIAWKLAWQNVKSYAGVPTSPLMKEGFAEDRIWIWDTCLMAHFCKYAPDLFPGIESLDNFYLPIYDGAATSMRTHHPDNPPLFAWTEYEYFCHTGDQQRIEKILLEREYLQKHYQFMENLDSGSLFPWSIMHTNFKRLPYGYMWSGNPNGMDNTPRGFGNYDAILWLDAAAQQALSALYISRLAAKLNETKLEKEYLSRYEELKSLLNKHYWDDKDSVYYDLWIPNLNFQRVLTPASFWPMLAEVPTPEQAERMSATLSDPELLGGMVPCPSVARNDPAFDSNGGYWRGGVWLPTTYMTVKALEKYELYDLAGEIAHKTIIHMFETWLRYEPATIWECYSPSSYEPASNKVGKIVRPDFCGWSALGPISLLIENVLGFHHLDAVANLVCWRPRKSGRHGIKKLRLGNNLIDLIMDNGIINVKCIEPFKLEIAGRHYSCPAGNSSYEYSN